MSAWKETIESWTEMEHDWNSLCWLLENEESDWNLLQKILYSLCPNLLDEDEMLDIYERLETNIMKQPLERNDK